MLIAQFASKKFGGADSPGGSKDNWGKKNYLFALLGAVGGAALADLIKRGTGKNVLQGGLALIAYQVFVNEIAPQNTFLANNFGEEDNPLAYGYGYGQEMAPEYLGGYSEGDVVQGGDGIDYAFGADGYWRPTDESHRILTGADEELLGETLTAPGRLGETLTAPGRLGEDPYSAIYGAEGVN
jgi:hypothetical protein